MPLKENVQEMINTWMIAVNEDRDLTPDEEAYIQKLQNITIEELRQEDGLITQEELDEENNATHYLDYFKDRDQTRFNC